MEQDRGISIASTVLQFPYRDHVVNLLDTPGHRDFSEDTYRVLAAVDAAVMVLDAAKGIEAQTLKLFEVCKARDMPILTFVNKWDRPGREPLELMDQISDLIGLETTPVTWPVGQAGDFRGVIDRRTGDFVRFARSSRGATEAGEEIVDAAEAEAAEGDAWVNAVEEVALLDEIGATHDPKSFMAGETSPLFVGSALTNFGVRHLLDAVIDLAPSPGPREDADGEPRPLDAPFSAFVFKVQANMDPSHRDRMAFMRINSGRFERGMQVTHERLGKPFSTKFATTVFGAERDTVEEGFPGDVIGLVNASDLRIGDTLYDGPKVAFPPIPRFEPELFWSARPSTCRSPSSSARASTSSTRRASCRCCATSTHPPLRRCSARSARCSSRCSPIGCSSSSAPRSTCRRRRGPSHAAPTPRPPRRSASSRGTRVLGSLDGTLFALFDSTGRLARTVADNPDWVLERVVETAG